MLRHVHGCIFQILDAANAAVDGARDGGIQPDFFDFPNGTEQRLQMLLGRLCCDISHPNGSFGACYVALMMLVALLNEFVLVLDNFST